ncbi:MAG: peptidoglycan binding domain-containing protein, partial [Patescibacteria group bacterium]
MNERRNSVIMRSAATGVGWVSVFCFAILSLAGLWWIQASDEFFPGVKVGDTVIGGLTWTVAETLLKSQNQTNQEEAFLSLQLIGEGETTRGMEWNPTLDRLGVTMDVQKTLIQAWSVGRSGTLATRINVFWKAWWRQPTAVPSVLVIDREKLNQYIASLARAINIPLQEHGLKIQNHQFILAPGQAGVELQTEKLAQDIQLTVVWQNFKEPVEVKIVMQDPRLNLTQVQEVRDLSQIILSQELTLTHEQKKWVISKEDIESWIVFLELDRNDQGNLIYSIPDPSLDRTFSVNVDTEEIQAYLLELGKEMNHSPTPRIERVAAQKTL